MFVITLITINYNNLDGLQRTFASVRKQENINFEYVIIDAASNDGSMQYLKRYRFPNNIRVKKISEPDKGIYDGMNKGLAQATGRYIIYLNSGDCFADEVVLSKIHSYLADNQYPDAVYSNIVIGRENNLKRYWKPGVIKKYKFFLGWMPPHPSLIVKKCILVQERGFNTNYKVAADYDLMLKLFSLKKIQALYLDFTSVIMEPGGTSNRNILQVIRSNIEVLKSWRSQFGWTPYWIIITKPISKILQFRF